MGEDGIKLINEYVVKWAVTEKLADPSVVVGDTTAQEAAVPYPNEMRLMAAFMTSVLAATKRAEEGVRAIRFEGEEARRAAVTKRQSCRGPSGTNVGRPAHSRSNFPTRCN